MSQSIRMVCSLSASPEQVWAALTDCRHLAAWQADTARGGLEQGHITLGWPELNVTRALQVIEAKEYSVLRLASGPVRVEFTLREGQLELVHEGEMSEDEVAGTWSSWHVSLAMLAEYLKHHFGRSRKVHWSVQALPTTHEEASVFFTNASALRLWLGDVDKGFELEGESFQLRLHDGPVARGEVLATVPERDVALALQVGNVRGALVLRTLPAPLVEHARVVVGIWSTWGAVEPGVARALNAGFRRLANSLRRQPRA